MCFFLVLIYVNLGERRKEKRWESMGGEREGEGGRKGGRETEGNIRGVRREYCKTRFDSN